MPSLEKQLKIRLKRTVQQLAVKCGVPTPEIEFCRCLCDPKDIDIELYGQYDPFMNVIRLSLSSPCPRKIAIHEFIHYYLMWKPLRDGKTEEDVEELTEPIMQQPAEANVILSSFVQSRRPAGPDLRSRKGDDSFSRQKLKRLWRKKKQC